MNPNKGKEPGKTRPVLLPQDQSLLDIEHPTTIIIPLTTQIHLGTYPLRFHIKARDSLKQNSDALIDQIRTIDNKHLIGKQCLTKLTEYEIKHIYKAINDLIGNI